MKKIFEAVSTLYLEDFRSAQLQRAEISAFFVYGLTLAEAARYEVLLGFTKAKI